jgi:hypothetical protein
LLPKLPFAIARAILLVAASCPLVGQATTFRIEDSQITLVGTWTTEFGHPAVSGGSTAYVNYNVYDPGAYASFEFEGTGITWIGSRTYNGGLFKWIVDESTQSEIQGTVNTYIPDINPSTTELLSNSLAQGLHTFKFISLGIYGRTLAPGIPSETYLDAFDIVGTQADIAGDYNRNGFVDAADYVVWRKTFGQAGAGLAADGNGNGRIDAGDYDFWKSRLGITLGSGTLADKAPVPEPPSAALLIAAILSIVILAKPTQFLR